ncbi:hypothetical protein AAMO2058_001695700 [Amorphochlora amoebiformis]
MAAAAAFVALAALTSFVRLPLNPPPPPHLSKTVDMNRFWDVESEFKPESVLTSEIIKAYVLRGQLDRAEEWMHHLLYLGTLPKPRAFVALIEGNAHNPSRASHWLKKMSDLAKKNPGLKPPVRAFAFAIAAAACIADYETVDKHLELMRMHLVPPDAFVMLASLEAYKRGGQSDKVEDLTKELKKRGLMNHRVAQKYMAWTMIRTGQPSLVKEYLRRLGVSGIQEAVALLQTSVRAGNYHEGIMNMQTLLRLMDKEGQFLEKKEREDILSSAYGDIMYLCWKKAFHTETLDWYNKSIANGVNQTYDIQLNALRTLAVKDGIQCEKLFNHMLSVHEDVGHEAYCTVIEGLADAGELVRARKWVLRMRKMEHKLDASTYEKLILKAVEQKTWEDAEEFLDMELRDRVVPTNQTYLKVIEHVAYSEEARENRIKRAENWIRRMFNNGVYVLPKAVNCVIDARRELGHSEKAQHWLFQMLKFGIKPDSQSFLLAQRACAMTGDGDTAEKSIRVQRTLMNPETKHYNAVIEALARAYNDLALKQDRARIMFKEMLVDDYVKPNPSTFLAVTTNLVKNGWSDRMEEYYSLVFNAKSNAKPILSTYNRMLRIYANDEPPKSKQIVKTFK